MDVTGGDGCWDCSFGDQKLTLTLFTGGEGRKRERKEEALTAT